MLFYIVSSASDTFLVKKVWMAQQPLARVEFPKFFFTDLFTHRHGHLNNREIELSVAYSVIHVSIESTRRINRFHRNSFKVCVLNTVRSICTQMVNNPASLNQMFPPKRTSEYEIICEYTNYIRARSSKPPKLY